MVKRHRRLKVGEGSKDNVSVNDSRDNICK